MEEALVGLIKKTEGVLNQVKVLPNHNQEIVQQLRFKREVLKSVLKECSQSH